MRSVTLRTFLLTIALLAGLAACLLLGRALALARLLFFAEIASRGLYLLGRMGLVLVVGLWLVFILRKKRD